MGALGVPMCAATGVLNTICPTPVSQGDSTKQGHIFFLQLRGPHIWGSGFQSNPFKTYLPQTVGALPVNVDSPWGFPRLALQRGSGIPSSQVSTEVPLPRPGSQGIRFPMLILHWHKSWAIPRNPKSGFERVGRVLLAAPIYGWGTICFPPNH